MDSEICQAILDSFKYPIVFVDNEHIVRYLNQAARERYYDNRGYSPLIGKSIFECHNPSSVDIIQQMHKRLLEGESEIFLKINKDRQRVTVVAVRDCDGSLLGYYERFEDQTTAILP
jgi:DUF438 domain-containing protein